MDAFKLLTRSTKIKAPSNRADQSNSTQLPSAGQAATPQLFTDHGKASESQNPGRGKKRKRNIDAQPKEDAIVTAPTLFSTLSSSTSEPNVPRPTASRSQTTDTREDAQDEEVPVLSEPERKAILKTHKIKVTDLRTPPKELAVKDEQPKKKKKKRTEEKPVVLTRKQQKAAQRLYPEPLTSFNLLRSRYRISRRLAENILGQGYTVPTEVQLGSLPLLLGNGAGGTQSDTSSQSQDTTQDPDLLVVAPTGSGKTLAFMIPLINKVMAHHHRHPNVKGILGVIVAPTKELATQIVNEGRKLTVGTGVKVTAMRKGMRVVEELGEEEEDEGGSSQEESSDDGSGNEGDPKPRRISRNATITKSDILVTTPLLLVNSLSDNGRKEVSSLPSVESLVFDEADVLLDPLFRDQTLNIWRACVNPQLRVGLWSATMGSNIEELSKSTIKDRQINLGLKEESALIRLVVGLKDSAIPNIGHKLVYAATEQGKLLGLRQLLHPTASKSATEKHLRPPFLVFTQTIPRAVALHSELKYDIPIEAGGSSRIAVLHSELSDSQRADVMTGFRKGEIWILITTDLLSRGVDFRGINGVVNYDIPNSSASYIHRVGRTGRAGREGGIAVTFYTKEDIPYVKNIANVIAASEKLQGGKVGEEGIQKWLLNALPDLSKRDKKELKQHGVKARSRAAVESDGKDKRKTRISTKSGFERRLENNRKGAIKGSRRRKNAPEETGEDVGKEDGAWGGFED